MTSTATVSKPSGSLVDMFPRIGEDIFAASLHPI
jgi:hypothetical protein